MTERCQSPGRSRSVDAFRTAARLGLILAALTGAAWAANAQYTVQGVGTMGELASEAAAINNQGQVAGTLTGT